MSLGRNASLLIASGVYVAFSLLLPSAGLAENTSYRQVGELRDVSNGAVRRYNAAIVIPPGRTRAQVDSTLRRAAREIGGRPPRVDALIVNGYREGESTTGIYTAGQAILAPNGNWGDAHKGGGKRISVTLGELYFKETESPPQRHQTARLSTPLLGNSVSLSDSYDHWGPEHTLAELRAGSTVQVLDRRSEVMSPTEMLTHYRVRTKVNGQSVTGWVHDHNLEILSE